MEHLYTKQRFKEEVVEENRLKSTAVKQVHKNQWWKKSLIARRKFKYNDDDYAWRVKKEEIDRAHREREVEKLEKLEMELI